MIDVHRKNNVRGNAKIEREYEIEEGDEQRKEKKMT